MGSGPSAPVGRIEAWVQLVAGVCIIPYALFRAAPDGLAALLLGLGSSMVINAAGHFFGVRPGNPYLIAASLACNVLGVLGLLL